jgi:hypothetical protein
MALLGDRCAACGVEGASMAPAARMAKYLDLRWREAAAERGCARSRLTAAGC